MPPSSQKKSDRCRKVIVDGMHAIAKLSAQAPSAILPYYARFLEVLLAGLTSPNASIRWAAVRGLGGVVRGSHQSWAASNVEESEAIDAESIRQQVSVCTLVRRRLLRVDVSLTEQQTYLQRSRPRDEIAILGEQLDKSIQTGDLAWALCTIGVVAAALGKRLRKLTPDGPYMLVARVQVRTHLSVGSKQDLTRAGPGPDPEAAQCPVPDPRLPGLGLLRLLVAPGQPVHQGVEPAVGAREQAVGLPAPDPQPRQQLLESGWPRRARLGQLAKAHAQHDPQRHLAPLRLRRLRCPQAPSGRRTHSAGQKGASAARVLEHHLVPHRRK